MDKKYFINGFINWKDDRIQLNGIDFLKLDPNTDSLSKTKAVYQHLGISYPKFFKMDLLSKAAFLSTEILRNHIDQFETYNKEKTATVLSTCDGCLEVDKNYEESRKTFPSPALFVYTLPNIMLGEICIRNGFKGEQLCTLADEEQAEFTAFYVQDLLDNRDTDVCICGFVNATLEHIVVNMRWVSKMKHATSWPFHPDSIKSTCQFSDNK